MLVVGMDGAGCEGGGRLVGALGGLSLVDIGVPGLSPFCCNVGYCGVERWRRVFRLPEGVLPHPPRSAEGPEKARVSR